MSATLLDRRHFLALAAAAGGGLAIPRQAAAADREGAFFFRDGDRVVMIGDSITEQHLHTNYIESYVLSRFPRWSVAFRNVGIGGDTARGGNARTERDVLSFQPTAVTITFGMNDAGYRTPADASRLEMYRTGLQGMADQLKAKSVRVAILSPSPVEKKEDGPALQGYNQALETFSATARELAEKNDFRFVDQFHPHLEVLQKARDQDPKARVNGGDAVHPGYTGQLVMAWAILKGLGAPSVVSSAEVDARQGKVVKTQSCGISGLQKKEGGILFRRADEALPWWIQSEARPILGYAPIVEELNRYLLTVTGLSEGTYRILADGELCATTTAAALAQGYNLALADQGPVARQAKALHDAVFAKNRYYHDQIFRGILLNNRVAETHKQAQIAERMQGMPALEKAVRDALALQPRSWDVVPAR